MCEFDTFVFPRVYIYGYHRFFSYNIDMQNLTNKFLEVLIKSANNQNIGHYYYTTK